MYTLSKTPSPPLGRIMVGESKALPFPAARIIYRPQDYSPSKGEAFPPLTESFFSLFWI